MRKFSIKHAGAVVLTTVLAFGAVSCGTGGPSRHCVDWDHDKVTKTVTPAPQKAHKRVYDSVKRKYVWKWVNGKTPKPYTTTYTKVECEEWETESSTPDN